MGVGAKSIAAHAYEATGGDPLAALLLVLDLIWTGKVASSRRGVVFTS